MTAYIVAKPFRTPLRRFVAGAEVRAADIDGVLTAEDWVRLGHLAAKDTPAPVIDAPQPVAEASLAPPEDTPAPRRR